MSNPFEDLRQAVVVRPISSSVVVVRPTNSPGPQGPSAPEIKIQYSNEGTSWHDAPLETDRYLRFSTNNGASWNDAIYFNNLAETLEWVEKAEKWAQEDEDVEVETGKYSAYHWAQKAAETTASPMHGDEAHTEDYIKEGDSRLTDARSPIAHASTHINGTDDIPLATSTQKGLMSSTEYNKLINTVTGPASSTDKNVAIFDGTSGKILKDGGITSNVWDVIIEDQKSQNTDGGTFASGAWQTRTLNTLVFNHNSLTSLSDNRFTLPSGTYCIDWDAPAFRVNRHQTALYNYSSSTIVAYGTSELSSEAGATMNRSVGTKVVTISSSTSFTIQHICQSSYSDSGFGSATNFGTEVYTRVRIKKIA